jgi:tRNA threonylcarbamoyl adenosine modification protein (Sua5/YciO/YrdC/YwlC family)
MHPRRKTIGLRVPDNAVAQALLAELGEPIMSTSLILPGEGGALTDIMDLQDRMGRNVDLIIDSGGCGLEPTTVIDLVDGTAQVLREGKGDSAPFQ